MSDKIKALVEQMAQLSDRYDEEGRHREGDRLLIEALRTLADDTTRADVEALIKAWDAMTKWYA